MVYLQGMSHQFQINVINTFYNKFAIGLVNFLNVFCFWHLKKAEALRFQFAIFLVINIYCFFDDHDICLLLLEYFLWFAQVSTFFERLFKCYFAAHISLIRKIRKKTLQLDLATHNHLVHKRTLNHLTKFGQFGKMLSVHLWTTWL